MVKTPDRHKKGNNGGQEFSDHSSPPGADNGPMIDRVVSGSKAWIEMRMRIKTHNDDCEDWGLGREGAEMRHKHHDKMG